MKYPVTIRFVPCDPGGPADLIAVAWDDLSGFPCRSHFRDVYADFRVAGGPDGLALVQGAEMELFFPPEQVRATYRRYRGSDQVYLTRGVHPVPDFQPDVLLGALTRPDPSCLYVLDSTEGGRLRLACLPRAALRPLTEVLLLVAPPTRDSIPVSLDESWLFRRVGRNGAEASPRQGAAAGRPRTAKPAGDRTGTAASTPHEKEKALPPGNVLRSLPAMSERDVREVGVLSETAVRAITADDAGAWFELFQEAAGGRARPWYQQPSASKAGPAAARLDADVCLVNAIFRDRRLLDAVRADPRLAQLVREGCRQASLLLDPPPAGAEGRPESVGVKARWLLDWLDARSRHDFFWAFEKSRATQSFEVLADLQVGRDLPPFLETLAEKAVRQIHSAGVRSSQAEVAQFVARIDSLLARPGRKGFLSSRVAFEAGSLVEDEPPVLSPFPLPEVRDYLKLRRLNAEAIFRSYAAALAPVGPAVRKGDRALALAYFDFLGALIDDFPLEGHHFHCIRLFRNELHTNLLQLARHPPYRPAVLALASRLEKDFLPRIRDDRFYAPLLRLLVARLRYDAGEDLEQLLASIHRLAAGKERPGDVDLRDLLMEALFQLLHLPVDDKLEIVILMFRLVPRVQLEHLQDDIYFNLRAFLTTLRVDAAGFLATFRRWEKWRIQKVVHEDLAAMRASEFLFNV